MFGGIIFSEYESFKDVIDGMTESGSEEIKRTLDSFVADPSQQKGFADQLLDVSPGFVHL